MTLTCTTVGCEMNGVTIDCDEYIEAMLRRGDTAYCGSCTNVITPADDEPAT